MSQFLCLKTSSESFLKNNKTVINNLQHKYLIIKPITSFLRNKMEEKVIGSKASLTTVNIKVKINLS